MQWSKMCACAMSFVMLTSLAACGGNSSESAEDMDKIVAQEIEIASGSDRPEAEEDAEEITGTTSKSTSARITTTTMETTAMTTAAIEESTASQRMTAATTKKMAAATTKKNNVNNYNYNNNSGGSSSGNDTDVPKSETTEKQTTSATTTTTAATTTTTIMTIVTTTTEPVAPEDVDKYVDFAAVGDGDGYTYDGVTLSIFTPGSYHLSGTLNGMVYINVGNEDKVKLRLNGVGITNTGAPCIQVDNADKVIVNVVGGSSNYLECYSTNAEGDAALYSKDDLKIKGCGSLYVFCDNEHGVACNNDLEIAETDLTIDAEKTAISSHKSVQILSGIITANGDNCGIRSWDSVTISGGYVVACGGKKAAVDRGGIISDTGNFCIEGGTVLAVGMNQTIPFGQSTALLTFPGVLTKDNVVAVSVDGITLASAIPNKKYNCILISDPTLAVGAIGDIWLNDAHYDTFAMTDVITQAALDGVV